MDGLNNISIFLSDDPCTDDSSFKVHEAIASAIANEIQTGEPSNIAVVADWGAGKSTILNLVKHKLDDSFIFFTFDAWAHFGDSLRKNFIQMLAKKISHCDPLSETDAEKLIKKMKGNTSHTKSEEKTSLKPIATSLFIVVGLYALFSAIINIFMPLIEISIGTLALTVQEVKLYCALIAFITTIVLPLIIGILVLLRLSKEKKSRFKGELLRELATFFAKKSSGTTSMIKRESTTPLDSLRFEKLFVRTLSLTNKKVVIAFDNLDRLNNEKLVSAWSTLEIFCSPTANIPDSHRPWVILPITRNAFSELESISSVGKTSGKPDSPSLSKLFIRNFEIPTLISTEWKQYFYQLTRQAFSNIDNSTLNNVYSIASHSLLKIEMRTPRNAKRFINAMVAKSRVFPQVSLISIAAYCYLRDLFDLKHDTSSNFSSFVVNATEDGSDEYFYLLPFAQQYDKLFVEISMLAFGQFSEEKAAEVRVVSKINNAISNCEEIDFSSLIGNNIGSWEITNSTIENELVGQGIGVTLKWIFPLLRSLDLSLHEINTNHEAERQNLVRILMAHIATIDPSALTDSGKSIASHIPICSEKIAYNIGETISHTLNELIKKATEEGSINNQDWRLQDYINEASYILQSIANYPGKPQKLLPDSLTEINLGAYYPYAMQVIIDHNDEDFCNCWLASKHANTVSEVTEILKTMHSIIAQNDFKSKFIRLAKEAKLLDVDVLSKEYIDAVKEKLNLYEDLAEWKISLWIMKNICNLDSPNIESLFNSIDFDLGNYTNYMGTDDPTHRFAIAMMAINYEEQLDKEGKPNKLIVDIFDADCASIAKDNDIDIFPELIEMASSKDACLSGKYMLSVYCDNLFLSSRPIKDCLMYAKVLGAPNKQCDLGRKLGSTDRATDLMKEPFDFRSSSIYLGIFETNESNKSLKSWILEGFQKMSDQEWSELLKSNPSDAIKLFSKISSKTYKFPNLDIEISRRIRDRKYAPTTRNTVALYSPNSQIFNNAINDVFFKNGSNDWKWIIENFGECMISFHWFEGLTANQRKHTIDLIVNSKTGYCIAWLESLLNTLSSPKSYMQGCLQDTRNTLKHNLKLNSVRYAYKKPAERILRIIS